MNRVMSINGIAHRRRAGLLTTFLRLASLSRQRNRLEQLDDAALNDIGITRAEAQREANRPIWSAPDHWMK